MRAVFCFCMTLAAALIFTSEAAADQRQLTVLAEAARPVSGGRGVQVIVPQAELGMNINPSYATAATGGGLIGVVIDANIQASRGRRASVGITPIRIALVDFDADQLAIDATSSALATLPWFEGSAPAFARDPTVAAKSAFLDSAGAAQDAFFEYIYDTAPDFSSIRVGVTISIANRDGEDGNPERRLQRRRLVYNQVLTSVVQLPNPGDGDANSQRWAANGGVLANRALTFAFDEIKTLIPRALTLSAEDIARMEAGARRTVGANTGKLVEESSNGTLLFNGGLIHVQTLVE